MDRSLLTASSPAMTGLVDALDQAVALGDVTQITERIKEELMARSRDRWLGLPDRYREWAGDRYARRLLHRNPELGYTVVVMTWGPGQTTQLHDHAGMWCVECVVDGELEIARFELMERDGERHRFADRGVFRSGTGEAGSLIPPFEYHVLGNARDEATITLHVYGGEMDHCNLYEPQESGWYRRVPRKLGYDD